MNIDFNNFQGALYLDPEASGNRNSLLGDSVTPASSFSHLDVAALTPESLNDSNSPVKAASIRTRSPESVLHQVCINLACTTEQLSKIMTGLACIGSAVNIKIDT
jgi:hypothetical protein